MIVPRKRPGKSAQTLVCDLAMKVANLSPTSVSGDLKEAVNAYSQAVKQLEATAREQEEEQQEASASGDNFKVLSWKVHQQPQGPGTLQPGEVQHLHVISAP